MNCLKFYVSPTRLLSKVVCDPKLQNGTSCQLVSKLVLVDWTTFWHMELAGIESKIM